MRKFTIYPQYISASKIVDDFRAKTDEMFHSWDGYTPSMIEDIARDKIEHKIWEVYYLSPAEVSIVDILLAGSRCRGLERKRSDIDIVLFYTGSEREDDLFDMLNRTPIYIGGHRVDINPIHLEDENDKALDAYLHEAEKYLENKARGVKP